MSELFERNGVKLDVKFKTKEYGKFPVDGTYEEFIEKVGSAYENSRNILEAVEYLSKETIYQVEEICLNKGMGPSRTHIVVSTYFRDFFITPSGYVGDVIAEFWHDGKMIFSISKGDSVTSW